MSASRVKSPVDHCCMLWCSVHNWGIYRFRYMHTCINLRCLRHTLIMTLKLGKRSDQMWVIYVYTNRNTSTVCRSAELYDVSLLV